jgi:hypothetical protein
MMSEKPIIFSAPMVRAILAGAKTQTRRVLKPQPVATDDGSQWISTPVIRWHQGDTLWVREAHYLTDNGDTEYAVYAADRDAVKAHLADITALPGAFPPEIAARHRKLRPSIHMPRWASRITLLVETVRVERLQDISEDDALAEGAFKGKATGRVFNNVTEMRLGGPEWRNARDWYADLWDTINGAGSWDKNPWVSVTTFRRIKP